MAEIGTKLFVNDVAQSSGFLIRGLRFIRECKLGAENAKVSRRPFE